MEVKTSRIIPKKALSVIDGVLALRLYYSIVTSAYEVGEKSYKRCLDDQMTIVNSTPNQRAFIVALKRAESLSGGIQNPHAQLYKNDRQASKKCLITEENGYMNRFLAGIPVWEHLSCRNRLRLKSVFTSMVIPRQN